ncbi:hypothetical protein FA09DRAFT_339506 [Tilletiopsis washingtonensis]|uniref:Phosphatidylglycerol/phosphatidylinositol transfer protein n=1 Tax=Tilletiopsis washingtonensis TaxID=58919 RepID=A0A316Z619_9BASI|nr:hypothetical protein FA09DRAFT_339506 [Tilletiopsis washingtonensis]PWN97011.1 hypothetical protein FA09DRAFT_339506 [Tilletiopsis washingtonensis]
MQAILFLSLVFAATVAMALETRPGVKPFGQGGACVSKRYNSNFDDRSFLPGVSVTNSIGTYNALAYQSFVGVDSTLPSPLSVSLNGLKNRSPPNVIATGLEPALGGQRAQISTLYPDSPVKTFNLHSFFFACVAHTGESAVSAIVPCTVHVEGFVNGKKTVEQQLVYQPKNLLKARMHYADFAASEWCDLDTVTFTVPCELSKALLLDNIDYTVHTCAAPPAA